MVASTIILLLFFFLGLLFDGGGSSSGWWTEAAVFLPRTPLARHHYDLSSSSSRKRTEPTIGATSQSPAGSLSSSPFWTVITTVFLRGGSDELVDDNMAVLSAQEQMQPQSETDSDQEKSSAKHLKPRLPSLSLSSPFQMYDVVRREASISASVKNEETSETPVSKEIDNPDSQVDDLEDDDLQKRQKKKKQRKRMEATAAERRGGASTLVHVEDDNQSNEKDGIELDHNEADQEDSEEVEEDDDLTLIDAYTSTTTGTSKFWWVNLWGETMEESSDRLGDEEDEDTNDLDSEPRVIDESASNSESDQVSEPDETEDKLTLQRTPDGQLQPPVDEEVASRIAAEENDVIAEAITNETSKSDVIDEIPTLTPNTFISSGAWVPIDNLLTLGLASRYSMLRISRPLRGVRKLSARVTGLHGVLSGKPATPDISQLPPFEIDSQDEDDDTRQNIQKRIAAIDKAREGVQRARAADDEFARKRRGLFGGLFRRKNEVVEDRTATTEDSSATDGLDEGPKVPQKTPEDIQEEVERMERVREIDRLIQEGQVLLQNLICEKDVLQRRPNPLFEYTTTETISREMISEEVDATTTESSTIGDAAETATTTTMTKIEIRATRKMKFPGEDLVDEYLDMMLSTRRLTKMNHTHLWQEETEDDEEESIGDDIFTPSANTRSLYQDPTDSRRKERGNGHGGGGSWLLRQSIGSGPTLGEKIGEAAETAAYKAVCKALMSFLARMLSSLHGINVLKHSDIRLVLEQAPDLPPLRKDGILGRDASNYAEETIKTVIRRKTRKSKKGSRQSFSTEDSFVQRDAVTEMLLSHVQISAPLLKLFPLAWQRALLGNIITLATAIVSDFLDGLSFQILGHQLSFAFRPITEEDLIQQFQLAGGGFNHRRYKPAEFEAAVQATAEDVSEELKFLDRWHERALGSGVLRTQIANMIARIVLTLTDEILSGARMDLWSAQANGPRILAGLEYRIETDEN